MKIQKAVIVAAGLSSRLYPLTLEKPKCLLPLHGRSLLRRSLDILKENGFSEIFIVTGFRADDIRQEVGNEATCILNPFYAHCNNMGSLWFAKNFVKDEPFAYLHADIAFTSELFAHSLKAFSQSDYDMVLATDFSHIDDEAMKVKVDANHFLLESSKTIAAKDAKGEWTGLAFIRSPERLFAAIEKVFQTDGLNLYDTFAFSQMAQSGHKLYCSSVEGEPWIEIDFKADYERAQEMFKGR